LKKVSNTTAARPAVSVHAIRSAERRSGSVTSGRETSAA
jgi:hypothetical protein